MSSGVELVIIDNTNMCLWEMRPYVEAVCIVLVSVILVARAPPALDDAYVLYEYIT